VDGVSRTRLRSLRAVARWLVPLGYPDAAAATTLAASLLREVPHDAWPGAAIALAERQLAQRIMALLARDQPTVGVTPAMALAALLSLDAGRHWPDALFDDASPPALMAALWQALPLALPPAAPLSMPAQSLRLDSPAAPCAPLQASRPALIRVCVFGATLVATAAAAWTMARVFSPGGVTAIETLLIAMFALNFVWIALTFWTGLTGLCLSAQGALPRGLVAPATDLALPRTAILIPIYNEDPVRIFAAVEAIHDSLLASGHLDAFEFFILSDSTQPAAWIREESLWDQTRQRLGATGRLFYRRRFDNTARKAGNLAEFCQRWGGHYEGMLVLDADSLMEGATIVSMVRLLSANPHVGLLQTVPLVVNRTTLFARTQQFAGRLYGPVLARGLAAWHSGDGNYWGHNALIRVRAFAAHAGLPLLPGAAPFGGHVLSHDFVEAALMRRAGWGIYMLSGLHGSYEEAPPSLVEHAQRDRRWCQGNLQHLRVIGAKGLHPLSRLHLLTGIMSYLSSPLWLAFLVVGVMAALQTRFELPQYFFPDRTPYPVWHVIDPELAIQLFAVTMAVLLAPKLFGWLAVAMRPAHARAFGGQWLLLCNMLVETVLSAITAPIQMLFQCRFVLEVLRGRDSGWQSQQRDQAGTSWREAWLRHRHHAVAGVMLGVAGYAVAPSLAAWMAPALLGMVLAPVISQIGSRPAFGKALQHRGVLLVPEELSLPPILTAANAAATRLRLPSWTGSPLHAVLADAKLLRLHLALLSQIAPDVVTANIALGHYRAHRAQRGAPLSSIIPPALEGAALADGETLQRLRQVGGVTPPGVGPAAARGLMTSITQGNPAAPTDDGGGSVSERCPATARTAPG